MYWLYSFRSELETMNISNQAVVKLKEPEGALVLNLSQFPDGPLSSLARIPPETAGVYSWFRSFNYPAEPEKLYDALLNDIEKVKFAERTGSIKPYYEVALRSRGWISEFKRKRIRDAVNDESFRVRLLETLNQSMLFQTPLYIGKSKDLRQRIGQHLSEGSILRLRLREVSIDIEETFILLVPSSSEDEPTILEAADYQDEEGDISNNSEYNDEDLMEEILSRLFNPQFTIRLG